MIGSDRASFQRREFLRLLLTGGAASLLAACQRTPGEAPLATVAPTLSPTLAATLPAPAAIDPRYVLDHDAVGYGPHPAGCDRIGIRGTVRDVDGTPQAGLIIRLWSRDPGTASALQTDGDGRYSVDIIGSPTEATYHLQLSSSSGEILLSDVIVAQAIPSCDLNLMTVDFIAAP